MNCANTCRYYNVNRSCKFSQDKSNNVELVEVDKKLVSVGDRNCYHVNGEFCHDYKKYKEALNG